MADGIVAEIVKLMHWPQCRHARARYGIKYCRKVACFVCVYKRDHIGMTNIDEANEHQFLFFSYFIAYSGVRPSPKPMASVLCTISPMWWQHAATERCALVSFLFLLANHWFTSGMASSVVPRMYLKRAKEYQVLYENVVESILVVDWLLVSVSDWQSGGIREDRKMPRMLLRSNLENCS